MPATALTLNVFHGCGKGDATPEGIPANPDSLAIHSCLGGPERDGGLASSFSPTPRQNFLRSGLPPEN